jgi:polygalacturonase
MKCRLLGSCFFWAISEVCLTGAYAAIGDDDPSVTENAPHEIAPIEAPFPMPQFKRPQFPDRVFDIRDFGAVEGGKVKNTDAIKKAIAAANEAGGGKALIPSGKWLTGAIHLESNVNLHVAKGAEVLFSQELKDYLPAVFSRHEGMECYKPSGLIYARRCENIAITGEGRLHGQGKPWWGDRDKRKMVLDGKTVTDRTPTYRNLHFSNIACEYSRQSGIRIVGLPEKPIEGLHFENISIKAAEGIKIQDARDIRFKDVNVTPDEGPVVLMDELYDVTFENTTCPNGADSFLELIGGKTKNIILRNVNLKRVKNAVVYGENVSKSAVSIE